jgi:hypothetical protein
MDRRLLLQISTGCEMSGTTLPKLHFPELLLGKKFFFKVLEPTFHKTHDSSALQLPRSGLAKAATAGARHIKDKIGRRGFFTPGET